jgi:hypothetical protein
MNRTRAVVASVALALGMACSAQTTETGVWRSPAYAAGPMKSVVVFGGRLSGPERHLVEDGYATALAARGVRATPSYALFPDEQQPAPEPSAIRAKLLSEGYDGALVSTLQGASDRILLSTGADWDAGFYSAYSGPSPMPTAVDQVVRFETALWSTRSGRMVWSATTATENPTSRRDFASSLTRTVVPSLTDAGMIPARPGQPVSLLR